MKAVFIIQATSVKHGYVQKCRLETLSVSCFKLKAVAFSKKILRPKTWQIWQDLLGSERALLQFYLRMGFEEMGGEDEERFECSRSRRAVLVERELDGWFLGFDMV